MSKKINNPAAEAVAGLKTDYDAKVLDLNSKVELLAGLDETATEDQKKEAEAAVELSSKAVTDAKALLDAATEKLGDKSKAKTVTKEKESMVEGVFLLSPTGRFGLAYNVGEPASLPELQANELEEAGYFKFKK